MTHGSLFSGIGGFDLAAEWMGWENKFHCEINEFCNKILNYYWPNAKSYKDITKTDFSIYRSRIDILTGGDPCQGNSVIGLGGGEYSNYFMWPHFIRAAKEIQPITLVNENVRGQISNGVIERKITDLKSIGYEVWPPLIIPASFSGNYTQRERVFIIANAIERRLERRNGSSKEGQRKYERGSISSLVEDQNGLLSPKQDIHWSSYGVPRKLDGITVSEHRKESLMAYGNAIVPQVAFEIFKIIEQSQLNTHG